MRLQARYEGRFILADGRPRAFRVYAWNKLDAAGMILRQAREELGDEAFKAATVVYSNERLDA